MIYLDHGATSWPKPEQVTRAMVRAMRSCGNPGRGGHCLAMAGAETVYRCRTAAGALFRCDPEQVVCTASCTHGLNLAIRTLVSPGDPVVISGFEHNAVTRTLHHLGAEVRTAGQRLFDRADTLNCLERELRRGVKAAVFTHVSNVFGYILPVEEMGALCRSFGVPFVVDAAQSAGHLPLDFGALGAAFAAMPGHKGLQGPMGTGLLLCSRIPEPMLTGGTGSLSTDQQMPDFLPDRAEAGTLNVPGLAGLAAGLQLVQTWGPARIGRREAALAKAAAGELSGLGLRVFSGPDQAGVLSFLPPDGDCETASEGLSGLGICVRAGLHCAPLAHRSAGTADTGTVRVSFGPDSSMAQIHALTRACAGLFFGQR